MYECALRVDLHRDGARQEPGGDDETRLAIGLSGLAAGAGLRIADIGCGSGATTRVPARGLDAQLIAVDFVLPPACWLDNEYRPLQDRFAAFLERHRNTPAAAAIVDAEAPEIAFCERYRAFVGCGYCVARRGAD